MITKREKFLLRKELDFHINRYLMANSCQRLDGCEKADHHIAISKILVGFITCDARKEKSSPVWKNVHDYLADILTDRMDEVIGFPIHTPLYGDMYTPLAEKFFSVIINHLSDIERIVDSALANER
jgi:hypothetical protein